MSNFSKIGFTLIELLVVIAIIGILSGLIIVSMSGVTNSANIAKSQVFSNSLRNALMLNLVSEWKLDENSGATTADSWSGGNTGTLQSSPAWKTGTDCVRGSCLELSGGSYVSLADNNSSLTSLTAFTVEGWVKYVSGSFAPVVGFSINTYHGLFINYNDVNSIIIFNSNCYKYFDKGNILDGKWHHFAFVVTEYSQTGINNARFYIDGVSRSSSSGSSSNAPQTRTHFRIGQAANGAYYLNGKIDDIRFYNDAMPLSLIREHYYSGLNKLLASGSISIEEYNQELSLAR